MLTRTLSLLTRRLVLHQKRRISFNPVGYGVIAAAPRSLSLLTHGRIEAGRVDTRSDGKPLADMRACVLHQIRCIRFDAVRDEVMPLC